MYWKRYVRTSTLQFRTFSNRTCARAACNVSASFISTLPFRKRRRALRPATRPVCSQRVVLFWWCVAYAHRMIASRVPITADSAFAYSANARCITDEHKQHTIIIAYSFGWPITMHAHKNTHTNGHTSILHVNITNLPCTQSIISARSFDRFSVRLSLVGFVPSDRVANQPSECVHP